MRNRHKHRLAHIIGVAALLSAVLAPVALGRQIYRQGSDEGAPPFVDPATLDPRIPAPESVIGHDVGETAVRYDDLVRYLRALADSSDMIKMTAYAQTHEGRTLYYLTITSHRNHTRLEAIKADNAKLADPRQLRGDAEARRILENLPGVAWMAYAIHGDELSSTDAAMQVAYQLVAGTDTATKNLRDQLVIHIDPLMNPDGRERYLAQLQTLQGEVANPDYQAMQHSGLWSAGRGNHYLFDLNRDWLPQVHPETRGRAAVILPWNPHLVVDSHEMGSLDTYLFDPPREPINVNLAESALKWRRQFSADQAAAFDRHGWSYYTREWYEEWYPGYTN
ncbi:MAG: M14 family zinc carboxypeptidase, partial [Planctomycetota bacterium]